MLNKIKQATIFSLLVWPAIVFGSAGDIINPTANPNGILPYTFFGRNPTVGGIILGIINLILALVGLIAVAMIVYGGFRYVTSAGNEDVVKAAKKTIINAIIGLIIVILSYVIVTAITNLAFGQRI
jgi:amino acid transporter